MDVKKLEVLSYEQELIIINTILEKRDLDVVSREVGLKVNVIDQVAWKYKDVIALLISEKDINDRIEKVYNETLDEALQANQRAIKLLSRQINILYDEYFSEANKGVVMKDYLIDQIIKISDKLQKMVDTNYTQFKDNRDLLSKRVAGFKVPVDTDEAGEYGTNQQAVFDKISKLKGLGKVNAGAATISNSFDLYEDGKFLAHFESAKKASEAGYGNMSAISRAIHRSEKEPDYKFKGKYEIRNVQKGARSNGK